MSGKTEKAKRREQTIKVKDFEKRRESMLAEMKRLSEKYRIDVVGSLQYSRQALIPMVGFMDVKDQYEHLAKGEKIDKGKNGELKPKLKV